MSKKTRKRGLGPVDEPMKIERPAPAPRRPRRRGLGPVDEPPGAAPEAVRAASAELAQRTIAARAQAHRAWAPHLDPDGVPPGYVPRGTSILRDADGNVKLVWTKTTRDADPFTLGEQVAAGLAAGGLEALPELPPPNVTCDDLLSVYPLGDPHIGLYAWAAECGESFDLDIAERQYLAVASRLLPRAPQGSDALLIDLGDFFTRTIRSTGRARGETRSTLIPATNAW